MPLPAQNEEWPPRTWREVFQKYAEWAAWYSGDPNRLATVHSGMVYTPTPRGRFWAKELKEERETMLHVPIAGDIASVSADLLFSEPPVFTIPGATAKKASRDEIDAQERLDEIVNKNDTFSVLLELGETAAAMSGAFVKVNWDRALYDFPILSVVQADAAIPVFQWGHLREVTFYQVIREEQRHGETYIFRHVEHHEPGSIQNRLYVGTRHTIGREIALEQDPHTELLEPDIATGIDDLLVRYVPNKRPNRLWRGSPLGQGDYGGVEGLMDALDETYTSWLRDIRLARARIIVPEVFLEFDKDHGEGRHFFDIDKSVFAGLNMGPPGEEQKITLSQFDVRAREHRETSLELLDRIISSAGYSPQSFGLKIEGRAESGTALRARERKSLKTRQKKQVYMERALADILELVLRVDVELLGHRGVVFRPEVEFADSLPDDPTEAAESVRTLFMAESASVDTRVRLLHPDWDEDRVDEEVRRIQEEQGIMIASPELPPDRGGE